MQSDLPPWIKNLVVGWPMIKANPGTFIGILFLAVGIVWIVFNWTYGSIIEIKNSEIKLLDRQIKDFREKSQSATPEDIRKRLDASESAIAELSALTKNPAAVKPDAETIKDEITNNKDGTFWVTKIVQIKSIYVPPVLIIEVYAKEIVEWNIRPIDIAVMPIWFDVDKSEVKSAAIAAPFGRYIISVRTRQEPKVKFNLRFS